MYRSGVGILIHVALDRGEWSFATRVCAKKRNDATKKDLERLKRVCNYALAHDTYGAEYIQIATITLKFFMSIQIQTGQEIQRTERAHHAQ